ncbi:hypothetical protein IVB27_38605 [Bradyrhizobium sp. 197]|nr:hypothetical protein [Bradyrhizobium sp. 197]MCK1480491.1 hypothetical protein [Bradyrhizobium sp. 197]
MWTLLVLIGTVLMTIVIVLGLFKAAGLNRVEDLIPAPSKTDNEPVHEE